MPDFIQGIDVSQWQGYIDFAAVKGAGISVVYIKSSEGFSFTDPFFERNYSNAKAAGLFVGLYHYVTAQTAAQAKTQAHFFAEKAAGKAIDCRLVMDFENLSGLTNPQIRDIALAFLEETQEATNKKCMIYSNYANALRLGPAFAKYPLWQAQYGVSTPSPLALWPEWTGWQHSDSGLVRGINGRVDMDYFKSGIFLSDNAPVIHTGAAPIYSTDDVIYRIKSGDTLSSIAALYHTTAQALAAYNHIADPNLIYTGDMIKIPLKSTNHHVPVKTYTIKSGDTLSQIALNYHTTLRRLIQLNHIKNPDIIYPGQILKI